MLILTAESKSPKHTESWEILPDTTMYLGRNPDNDCSTPWDHKVSRNHAELKIQGETLLVRCLQGTRNLIQKEGQKKISTEVAVGESFQIGQTRFRVTSRELSHPAVKVIERGVGTDTNTTSMLMSPADIRLAMVSQSAPKLWMASDDKELATQALQVLSQVLTGADLLVVVSCKDVESAARPKVVHWHKDESGVQAVVSRELIAQAIGKSETAIQVETDMLGGPPQQGRWSFCVPVTAEGVTPWCIYVAGVFGTAADYAPFLTPEKLKPDACVTELVSHLMGAIRSVRSLENRFEGIRQFFSPSLLESIAGNDSTASLQPQETDVVAIYCDLRGFSKMVAESSGDLHGLLARISGALSVMTQSIIQHHGAIADFQGDSALGFWGWPVALSNGALPAIRAALQIRRVFEQASYEVGGALHGFNVGIGIATGRAIAGRIGTRDHAKIGVFGPVVNIASRLEGMTRKVGATILMDDITAAMAAAELPAEEGRCRRIGKLKPVGFAQHVDVTELLPPESESNISDTCIEDFNEAVLAFETGNWNRCRKYLGLLPADDRCRDFLLVQMASQNYQPPADWTGVVPMKTK